MTETSGSNGLGTTSSPRFVESEVIKWFNYLLELHVCDLRLDNWYVLSYSNLVYYHEFTLCFNPFTPKLKKYILPTFLRDDV